MAYESLKLSGLADSDQGIAETKPQETKARKGRKKIESDSAIAKSEGHKLTNQQQSEAAELMGGLDGQEQKLTAIKGYQDGQNLARLRLAAKTAGTIDVLTVAALDRIQALQDGLKSDLQGHNPIEVLAGLGFNRTVEETLELRSKIEGLNEEDFSRFLL